MTRVYLVEAKTEERSALRLLLLDLQMEVVGEAGAWSQALVEAPASDPQLIVVDWSLLTPGSDAAISELRAVCSTSVVIVLLSHLDAAQQAAAVTGADAFISKGEMPDRIAERLREAAKRVPI